ncbi:PAAR-like protein [Leptotrichia massiliensis]|uniref:PAAR-like protein n=1 Tax=Leptotrichia massiliensis TaxID=1852388 RepID=UPI0028D38B87|nr:PAAR-like protein [Leptotrichia massiliensis]
MVNRKFNGVDIGDSAVAFFEKLAKLESGGKYDLADQKYYIGKYQIGTDVLMDMGWLPKGSTWANARFIGEGATKWKLTGKQSFLNTPAAQDEVIMRSVKMRWATLKKHKDKICKNIAVPRNAVYKAPGKVTASEARVKTIIMKKRNQGYKAEDLRGRSFLLTSSGMLAASHLCGQGAMSNALENNFKGVWGIPVDGNAMPSLLYAENLAGHDLSVIIGFKDNCEVGHKVVEKNHTQTDNKNINKQAAVQQKPKNNVSNNSQSKPAQMQKPVSTSNTTKIENVENDSKIGVFTFNGQKFEEVWDSEEYKRDRAENGKAPELAFVNPEESILKRLQGKFQDENLYNQDYVKYLETKTGKKVLEENKEDINVILKIYDEATKDNGNIGNVIRQHGFDVLRGREENNEVLRIQDIVYYIYSYPIPNKTSIESLEYVLSQYSAKYVKFLDKKPVNKFKKQNDYMDKIQGVIQIHVKDEEVKIEKNQLPEKYDKYMQGIKDIDEIVIKVSKKQPSELQKTRCENLIRELGENELEYEKTYLMDENGVRQFPLSRRLIDNIIIEFLKVQTGFKEENEIKYFDNHKYRDSNIVRNYLLWYIKKHKGIDLPSKSEMGLFDRLEKIGKDIRVTTVLNDWITSKSAIKVRNIRKISNLIDEVYENYRDNSDFEKDKSIIQALFKDSKELRDYAANIDSMDLYSFYKSFYDLQNIINPTGELFVNTNCMLKCTLGKDISRLIINEDRVMLRGAKQANINDTNIQPFKSCSAIGICQPALIGTWEKNTDVKVRDKPALLDISTIQCMHGGILSIDDAGQKEVGTAVTKTEEVKEAERDADCQYKLLINICSDINNNFMQTQLKKEAQKYAKWKKYKAGVMDNMRSYFAKDVKNMLGMRKLSESERKNKEDFIKINKAKMQIANQEVTPEKEKYLRKKIYAVFKEAYKSVKQKSGPKFDTKGVVKNHGLSLCDYERKNFYSAKMLPVITYGYLMRSGNLTITENSKRLIESELNNDINTTNTGQIKLQNYKIQSNVRQTKTIPKQRIKASDIANWIGIGKMLYTSIKHAPTANDILNGIRKNGRSVAVCPFSQGEWDETHSSSKSNNTAQKKSDNSPKMEIKENTAKYQSNILNSKSNTVKSVAKNTKVESNAKSQNNTKSSQTVTSCKTCPHTGVQGYYTISVRRIEETKLSTLSEFSILDPSGKKVEGYNGYIIEREGPDTVEMLRKKRIIAGTHELRWHYREDPRNYWAIGVYNHQQDNRGMFHKILNKKVLIHEERWILIHPGTSRGSSVGCLIIAKSYYKDGLLHRCGKSESFKFMEKIIKYTSQIEGKKLKNHEVLRKFKLKVSNEFKK